MIASLSQKRILLFKSLFIQWEIPQRVFSSRIKVLWMRISVLTFLHFQTGKYLHCLNHSWLIELSKLWVFDPKTTKGATNNTPDGYPLLDEDENGPARKSSWKYRGSIVMIGYLQGTTRPDIALATHQFAIFNNDQHLSHEWSVKCIGRYLLDIRDKGMISIALW